VQIRRLRNDLVVFVTLHSRNVYATFDVVGAVEDATTLVRQQTLLERAREAFEGHGIQLRFEDRARVPRPGERRSARGTIWHESDLIDRRRLYLRALRDPRTDFVFDMLSTTVGFVPFIGDVFDIGHLAYALLTGEDFAGRDVDTEDLLWMGLALLPAVPYIARHARGAAPFRRARRLIEESNLSLEEMRRIIRLRRPGLSRIGRDAPAHADVVRLAVASGLPRDALLLEVSRRR
jgi:hypothetical protein